MIHYIDGKQLSNEIIKNEKLVLTYFCISNSEPCEKQMIILRELEKEFNESVSFFKVNLEDDKDTQIRYDIFSFPTIQFFSNNNLIESINGVVEKEKLAEIIKEFM